MLLRSGFGAQGVSQRRQLALGEDRAGPRAGGVEHPSGRLLPRFAHVAELLIAGILNATGCRPRLRIGRSAAQQATRQRRLGKDPESIVPGRGDDLELDGPLHQVVEGLLADQAEEVPNARDLVGCAMFQAAKFELPV
jgi:hypothetical protein